MGRRVDLHVGAKEDAIADENFVTVKNCASEVDENIVTAGDMYAIVAEEGRLDDAVGAD